MGQTKNRLSEKSQNTLFQSLKIDHHISSPSRKKTLSCEKIEEL